MLQEYIYKSQRRDKNMDKGLEYEIKKAIENLDDQFPAPEQCNERSLYILNGRKYVEVQFYLQEKILSKVIQEREYEKNKGVKELVAEINNRRENPLGFIPMTRKAYEELVAIGNFWPVKSTKEIQDKEFVIYKQFDEP